MNLNSAIKALILMASLPSIKMATHGNALQRRAAAFSTLACRRQSPATPTPAQQQYGHTHTRQATTALPPRISSLATMQVGPLAHTKQSTLFSRHRSTSSASIMQQFMASDGNNDGSSDTGEEVRTSYNVSMLKKETTRLVLRTIKKCGKASTKIRAAEDQYEKLRVAIDESEGSSDEEANDKLLAQLERAPNVEQFRTELSELQGKLKKLNWLEEQFSKSPLKSKKNLLVEDLIKLPEGAQVAQYVEELEINDDENAKQNRIEAGEKNRRSKKERASKLKEQPQGKEGARLPYRRYYTEGQVEIRVGKQATDNDVLSLSSEHRSGAHWWYHASGCAGSHVVLCTDASKPSEEDILDAASLAALKSKCIGQSVIKVSMTRARNVSKPPGAKPGLVQLNGEVKTVTVKKTEVEKRCERLEETVIVN